MLIHTYTTQYVTRLKVSDTFQGKIMFSLGITTEEVCICVLLFEKKNAILIVTEVSGCWAAATAGDSCCLRADRQAQL